MTHKTTVGQTGQRAEAFSFFHIDLSYTDNLIFSYRINIVAGHFLFWYYKVLHRAHSRTRISQMGLDKGKGAEYFALSIDDQTEFLFVFASIFSVLGDARCNKLPGFL